MNVLLSLYNLQPSSSFARLFFLVFTAVVFFAAVFFFSSPTHAQTPTFTHTVIDQNGPSPMHAKDVGDYNSDGFLDLLISDTGGELHWYEYPTWTKHTITTSGGGWGTDLESGDINQDGFVDVIASDYYQNNRMVWFENPGASGSWTMHIIGSPQAHDIEVGDLDLDGDLDVVTRHQYSGGDTIHLWQQDSPTQWSHNTISTTGGEGLDIGDMDNDGDLDVVAQARWYENTGNILSGSWDEYITTTNWSRIDTVTLVSDVNQDGKNDLVLTPSESAGNTYKIAWYEGPTNPKTDTWSEHIVDPSVETVIHGLQSADMDLDGYKDIIVSEMHQGADPDEVKYYRNTDGSGTNWEKVIVDTKGSHNIRVVDIGNDGDYDIYGANWSGTNIVDLWENDVTPPVTLLDDWSYFQLDSSRSERYFGLAMADFTNDGFKDIASGQYFYQNPGGDMSGIWNRSTFPQNFDALLSLNVDNDQLGDLFAMDGSGALFWVEAQDQQVTDWSVTEVGDLGISDHGISTQGYEAAQIIPGGKEEVLITVGTTLRYFEIPQDPTTTPWPDTLISSSASPEGIGTGDIDNDGLLDVTGSVNDSTMVWWKNPGDGTTNWTQYTAGSLPSAYADRVLARDLNGDQRIDIVVSAANGSSNGVYWFEAPQDPTQQNWIRHTVVSQDTTNSMDVFDMDFDGDFDIISGEHRGSETTAIWENDGLGTFSEHVVDTQKESHLGTRVSDLDHDGDMDIVSIAWDDFQDLHLWRNDAQTGGPSGSPTLTFTANPIVVQPNGSTLLSWSSTNTTSCTASGDWSGTQPVSGSQSISNIQTDKTYTLSCDGPEGSINDTVVITVDGTPPTITLDQPTDGQTVSDTITLSATATDNVSIASVQFQLDGNNLGSALTTPVTGTNQNGTYEYSWNTFTTSNGQYTLTAIATDGANNQTTSNSVTITVDNHIDLSTNLQHHYSFDENSGTIAQDSSGTNDGTVSGATWSSGQLNSALSFDGQNDYVDINTPDVTGSALTLSAWINPTSFATHDARIITKSTGTAEQDHYWMLSTINNNGPKLRLRLKTNNNTTTLIANSGTLETNTWTHVAATYDGQAMKLYKDGVEVGSTSKTGSLDTSNSVEARIGQNPNGYGTFDGTIDDVRIYSRALNETELQALFGGQGGNPQNVPPQADAGTDQTLEDSDDNGTESVTLDGTNSSDSDGTVESYEWTEGGQVIATGVNPLVDLSVGVHTITLEVTDDLGAVDQDDVVVTVNGAPDTTAPTITVDSPTDGQTVSDTITLSATATDNVSIASVQFQLDGNNLGSALTTPVTGTNQNGTYEYSWNTFTTSNGQYTLTAIATDGANNQTTSNSVTITVDNHIDLSTNLQHHYSFDENSGTIAQDSSGTNDGTVSGATWSSGQLNSALSFDGQNDYVDINTPDVTGSALTLSAWINPTSFATHDARIITKSTGTAEQDHYWMLSTINNNGPKLRLRLKTNNNTTTLIANSGTLETNTWTHVAATYDGQAMKLYKDGVEVGSTSKTGSLDTSNSVEARIGQNPNGYGTFDGTIDDVRIYSRALNETELQALFGGQGGNPQNVPPQADAGTDQTLEDSDDNGTESVTLDGTNSSDSDGTVESYEWTEGGQVIATGVNPLVDLSVGVHTITLEVTDDLGAVDQDDVVVTVNGALDTEAPTQPLNLLSTNVDVDQATLVWDESTDNVGVTDYVVYQDGLEVVTSSQTTAIVLNLTPNTEYEFEVLARDAAGNESDLSLPILVTTESLPAPVLSIDAPQDGSTVLTSDVSVTYSQSGDLSLVDHVHLWLDQEAEIEDLDNDGSFTFLSVSDGEHTINMYMVDAQENQIGDSQSVTVTVDTSVDPSLVFHYKFNENSGTTAIDSVGTNNGTVSGATWTQGQLGNALDFDGNNDYVDINTPDVTGSALTLSAWINSNDLSNCSSTYHDCRIISKATGTSQGDHYWMLSTIKNGNDTTLRFRLKTNGVTKTLIASSGVLSEDTWAHVAATYDGSEMRLYKDGIEVGSTAKTGTLSTNGNVDAWIGRNPGGYGAWDGKIDDVRIYSRALSENELLLLAQ